MSVITTNHDLRSVCTAFADEAFVAVDTEFLRETTYWPQLCLIQLAGRERAVVIDALAEGLDLSPFFALMGNETVLKVFHAARQDLEIIWYHNRALPAPLFDTQIAASVLGFGEQVAYDQIVAQLVDEKIDKSHRFTDWSRRPLSAAQISYALADVVHLRPVYEKLHDRLIQKKRESWVKDEMDALCDPALYNADPALAWMRLRGRLKKPRDVAVMMALTRWRETEALARNVPRGRLLKDDAILDMAQRAPQSVDDLAALRGVPQGFARSRDAQAILAAVAEGLDNTDSLPAQAFQARRPPGSAQATVELLKVLLKQTADEAGIAPRLLASTDDLEDLAQDDQAAIRAQHGWRYEVFGEKALRLKRGEIFLGVRRGRVVAQSAQNGDAAFAPEKVGEPR